MQYERLKRYCDAYGPSGHESRIMDLLEEDWARATPVRAPIGNLLGHIPGNGPRLLIETHADEIALMVKSVSEDGFLHVTQGVFGSETETPPGAWLQMQPVMVRAGRTWINGLIGLSTGHVRTAQQRKKHELEWSDIFVDIGARDRAEVAERDVEVGAPVIFASEMMRLGPYVAGKALDARAGLAIMTELLERLEPERLQYDLYLGATIQEEVNLIGAAAMAKEPFDLVIGLEIGLAGDIPTVEPQHLPTRLGAGPVILVKDRQLHYDARVTEHLKHSARDAGIPYQLAVFPGFSSDAREFMAHGIPSGLVTYATRYTHSSWEVASLEDMENIVELLLAVVYSPAPAGLTGN
jgi:tetrahedral aminopeptidase